LDDEDATQATTHAGCDAGDHARKVGESSGKRSRQHSITSSPLGSQAAQSEGPPPCRKEGGERATNEWPTSSDAAVSSV